MYNRKCKSDPSRYHVESLQNLGDELEIQKRCDGDFDCEEESYNKMKWSKGFCFTRNWNNKGYPENLRYPVIRISKEISDGHGDIGNAALWDLLLIFSSMRINDRLYKDISTEKSYQE